MFIKFQRKYLKKNVYTWFLKTQFTNPSFYMNLPNAFNEGHPTTHFSKSAEIKLKQLFEDEQQQNTLFWT